MLLVISSRIQKYKPVYHNAILKLNSILNKIWQNSQYTKRVIKLAEVLAINRMAQLLDISNAFDSKITQIVKESRGSNLFKGVGFGVLLIYAN